MIVFKTLVKIFAKTIDNYSGNMVIYVMLCLQYFAQNMQENRFELRPVCGFIVDYGSGRFHI